MEIELPAALALAVQPLEWLTAPAGFRRDWSAWGIPALSSAPPGREKSPPGLKAGAEIVDRGSSFKLIDLALRLPCTARRDGSDRHSRRADQRSCPMAVACRAQPTAQGWPSESLIHCPPAAGG